MKAKLCALCLLSCIVISLALVGCSKKSTKGDVSQASRDTENTTANTTPQILTEYLTNIYINGEKVNLYSSRIDDTRRLLGSAPSTRSSGTEGPNHETYAYDVYDGIQIEYRTQDSALVNIVIHRSDISVELGGRVGDRREAIVLKYKGGFYQTVEGITYKDLYYYLIMSEDRTWGTGFRFLFEDDIVTSIVIGSTSFAP
jgi:hypothetical protein